MVNITNKLSDIREDAFKTLNTYDNRFLMGGDLTFEEFKSFFSS